jgi:hypothetical protein
MACPPNYTNIGVIPPGGTDSEVYTGNIRRTIETVTPVVRGPAEPTCSLSVQSTQFQDMRPAESAYLVTKVQKAPSRVYNTGASCGSLPAPIPNGGCTPIPASTPGNQNYRVLPRESRIDRYALPARTQPGSTVTARIKFAAAAATPFPVYVIPPQNFNGCQTPAPSSGGVPKPPKYCLNAPNPVSYSNPRH